MRDSPIIHLMGPTASGKTELAIALATEFPLEIISVDSALVYREMDIGTAKPSKAEQEKTPHHLIDICNPNEPYSVGLFLQDAAKSISEIRKRQNIPLLVGGTMLYFNAFVNGLAEIPKTPLEIRQRLQLLLAQKGLPYLYDQLLKKDPLAANRLHANDMQRILRALEVIEASGKTLSQWHAQQRLSSSFNSTNALALALFPEDRIPLHQLIERRFKKMLTDGFVEEVLYLQEKFQLAADTSAMRCVGYRQVLAYLQAEYDYSTMFEKGVQATRQLAKRQMTWLKSWPGIQLVAPYQSATMQSLKTAIEKFLS